MAKGLQKLRREAGYASANEFAEEMGISYPTYSRYEANPEKIPLKAAWQLADRFHASIDYIVGRVEEDPSDTRGDVQCAYDSLAPRLKAQMDDYLDYLIERNVDIRQEQIERVRRSDEFICSRLEQVLYAKQDKEGDLLAMASPDAARESFEKLLKSRVRESGREDGDQTVERIMAAYDRLHPSLAQCDYLMVDLEPKN